MATIKEVAELADVSPSTVSNVYTGRVQVREKTRLKVLAAAESLAYVPNDLASSLRTKERRVMAFSVGDIANPSYSIMVRAASNVFRASGYHSLMFNCDENPEQEREIIDVMCQQQVAGALMVPSRQDPTLYRRLVEQSIPVVLVDRAIVGFPADVVRSDDVNAFSRAAAHLIDRGHRRLAVITGPTGSAVARERVRGVQVAMDARGLVLESEMVLEGPSDEAFGYHSLVELMRRHRPPTAVLTASTRLTLGVLYAMERHGWRRPDDLDLVASAASDLQWLALLTPPLTVVAQRSAVVGRIAAGLLVARLTGERTGDPEQVLVEPELIAGYPIPEL